MHPVIGVASAKRLLGRSAGRRLRRKCNRIGSPARQAFRSRTISASLTFSNASRRTAVHLSFTSCPNNFLSEILSRLQMDIEKPSYADKPLVFALHADWRPRQLEEAEAVIGLPSAKTRDRQLVRGYILGAAIQIGRENPEQWISYSRNHNYYANPARKRYWPVSTTCMRLSFRPWISLPVWN